MGTCMQDELKALCIETMELLKKLKYEKKISEKEYCEHIKEKERFLEKLELDKKDGKFTALV